MTLPNGELEERRETLCDQLGLVKDALSFFRVPEKYQEDLVQEIFIVAYRHIDKINDMSKLNSWFYKISYRKMLSFMQKQRFYFHQRNGKEKNSMNQRLFWYGIL